MKTVDSWGLFLVLLSLALFPSCDTLHNGDSPLAGTTWTLTLLNGQLLATNTNITLDFEELELGGLSGCNQYGGPYSASFKGSFSIRELAQTDQLCLDPPGIMDQEALYVDAFIEARVYRVRADRLEFKNADGDLILVFDRQ